MSTFDEAIGPLLEHEGSRLVPEDNGRGASKWGVTLATYREYFPHAMAADIAALGREQASAFYRRAFWERCRIGLIDDQALANKALDLAVNLGGRTAVKLLQRTAGAREDGILGPATAAAVNSRPAPAFLALYREEAEEYYRHLVLTHPHLEADLPEWLSRLSR